MLSQCQDAIRGPAAQLESEGQHRDFSGMFCLKFKGRNFDEENASRQPTWYSALGT